MDVETRMGPILFESEKYQYQHKFIDSNRQPRVPMSTFTAYIDNSNPAHMHLFMTLEEWKFFIEAVGHFD